jgi:hypothetical protein
MNPHDLEQEFARFRDTVPRLWRNTYDGCRQVGFTPAESFVLLQTWILAQNPKGIVPPTATPDKEPE